MKYFVDLSDKRNALVKKFLEKENITASFSWQNTKDIDKGDACIFSPAKKFTEEEIALLPSSINLICGNLPENYQQLIESKDIKHTNIMKDEVFTIKNANLTAEGVLALILERSPRSIFENNILIIGGGRIARSMAILLRNLGAKFSIVSFNEVKFPSYYLYTKSCYFKYDFVKDLSKFDVIINTIPAKMLDSEVVRAIAPETLFIETASVNCLEANEAKHFTYLPAPALPMKYSAETAGKLMYESIIGGRTK